MKRPMLICGITMIVASSFLMTFSKIATIITVILAASVLILYSIKPLKLRKHIIIPAICIFSLILTLQFNIYTSLKIDPVKKYDQQIANVSGSVITLPESNKEYIKLTLETDSINYKDEKIKAELTLPKNKNTEAIRLYDYITLKDAELSVPRNSKNNYDLTAASDGAFLTVYSDNATVLSKKPKDVFYYCLSLKETVSERIDLFLEENTAGVLKGMLFGGSNDISKNTLTTFRNGGIAHLLAVSGLHTSLWCGLLLSILSFFKIKDKTKNSLCVLLLLLLCIVSGFTPSVTRASLMMLIILLAPFFKRTPDSLNSLGIAVTILLLCNPYTVANISFQLSVAATFGVLVAVKAEKAITEKTKKIKIKPIKKLADYILTSVSVSTFASFFTLPVSAYYFGVFCIFSPITNLLCVQLAFYGMIAGVISTTLSFNNIPFVRDISLFLFRVTGFILNLVEMFAETISKIEFCTIPIHKNWLINAIVLASFFAIFGYIIFKIRKSKGLFLKLASILCVIALLITNLVPIFPTPYSDEVTIISSGNNTSIVVRSGLRYAYILNTTESIDGNVYSYLPKATCEKLDYFIVSYASASTLKSISALGNNLSPGTTYTNEVVNDLALTRGIDLPKNTIISIDGNYVLSDKISIEIVDTYRIKYAIIKGNKKTMFVHLSGSTDFSDIATNGADIFVYNAKVPKVVPSHAKTIIINTDSSIYTNSELSNVTKKCSDVRFTARDGDIHFTI